MKSLTELNDKGEGRGINNNNNKKQNLDQRQIKLQAQIRVHTLSQDRPSDLEALWLLHPQ